MTFRNLAVFLCTFCIASAALADDSFEVTGAIESGLALGVPYPSPPASKVFVDGAELNLTKKLDKTKFVFNNALAVSSTSSHANFEVYDGKKFWGFAMVQAGNLNLANTAAYVGHQLGEGVELSAGYKLAPFGMEFLTNRFSLPSYYYSYAITYTHDMGWMRDIGIFATLTDSLIPGTFEIGVMDGRQVAGGDIPKAAARWHRAFGSDDFKITPVVSGYLGGFPPISRVFNEGGLTLGAKWEAGNFWANAEWLMLSEPTSTANNNVRSLVLEPGLKLGDYGISAKVDFASFKAGSAASLQDTNLALVFTKQWDRFRLRATCLLAHLNRKLSPDQVTDVRFLFGTSF